MLVSLVTDVGTELDTPNVTLPEPINLPVKVPEMEVPVPATMSPLPVVVRQLGQETAIPPAVLATLMFVPAVMVDKV
jgi:hypothetical protein